jgi:predicted DNA binding CopG/RHH family protein
MKKHAKQSEAAVADYWLSHDSTDDIDWEKPGVKLEFAEDVERPTQSVTIRLPGRLLRQLKVLARERDVPYQFLMKVMLADMVTELRKKAG